MAKYVYRPLEVEGFVITHVRCICQNSEYELTLENGDKKLTTPRMCARMTPVQGDYWVIQPDGYEYLNPKEVFERKFIEKKDLQTTLTFEDVHKVWAASKVVTMKLEPKTALVKATLPNGFEIVETASCVDPANYDEKIGKEICCKRIMDKIWELEGYVLQSKVAGKMPKQQS
jgi:hypothetical protein